MGEGASSLPASKRLHLLPAENSFDSLVVQNFFFFHFLLYEETQFLTRAVQRYTTGARVDFLCNSQLGLQKSG